MPTLRPGPAALRVGVTGHRPNRLTAASLLRLPGQIRTRLQQLEPASPATLVCSLAEGVDRIAATAALDLGWSLRVLLPFPEADYLDDFASVPSRSEFQRLMSLASSSLVVASGRDPRGQGSGYLAAGLAMLAEIDVLLVVHDGGHSRGEGGAHDLMHRAKAAGLPVEELVVG